MELKNSKTHDNLMAAFGGETQAFAKYLYFSKAAENEGYMQLGSIFRTIAENEKQHAKIWFKLLGGLSETLENLNNAQSGEHYENAQMYPSFAKTAREEGFSEIARLFEEVGKIEKTHEECYKTLISEMNSGKIFSKDTDVFWICRNCGHIHIGTDAPEICPVCEHPKGYFEVKC